MSIAFYNDIPNAATFTLELFPQVSAFTAVGEQCVENALEKLLLAKG